MQRNVKLVVAYDGTEFHGWQSQPELRTVQDLLEQAARRVTRQQVDLMGSGRTDAGVHAAGQVANFSSTCPLPVGKLLGALGARLPKDITLLDVSDVHAEFHASRSATSKLYRYRIHNAVHRPVRHQRQPYCYHFWQPLDLEAMRAGAEHMIGTMDFASLAGKSERETTVRTVFRCEIQRRFDEIIIDVEGGGFLYNQVRNMVGTLIEVGRGHWPASQVADIIAAHDRRCAGPTAPARGLCLQWVRYPAHLLRPSADEISRKGAKTQSQETQDGWPTSRHGGSSTSDVGER